MSANAFGVNHDEVSKASNWKTIDQRERAQRQNRKHAGAAASAGSLAAAGGAYYGLVSPDVNSQLGRAKSDASSAFRGRREMDTLLRAGKPSTVTGIKVKGGANAGDVARGAKAFYAGKGKGKLKLVSGLVGGGIATGVGANAAASGRNAYHQHKINERRRAAEGKRAAVSKSAFGVEHEISKRKDPGKSSGEPSTGRRVTGNLFGGFHGAVAGRKGTKLKAVGHEVVGGTAGTLVGGGAGAVGGAALGAVARRPLAGMEAGKSLGGTAGAIVGTDQGVRMANKKGYYKKEPKKHVSKAFSEPGVLSKKDKHYMLREPQENTKSENVKAGAAGGAVGGGVSGAAMGTLAASKMPKTKRKVTKPGAKGSHAPMFTNEAQRKAATGGYHGKFGVKYVPSRAKSKGAAIGLAAGGALGAGYGAGLGALYPHKKDRKGVAKAFSTKPLMGAMKSLKPKIAGPANKAMKLQPVKNAAAGFKATRVGVGAGGTRPQRAGVHAGIGVGHAATAGGVGMGAAGVGVGVMAGKKKR